MLALCQILGKGLQTQSRATVGEKREAAGGDRRWDEPLPTSCSWGLQGASSHKTTFQTQQKLVSKTARATWFPLRKLGAWRPNKGKMWF